MIVAEQLQAQHNAVKMLANRVRVILEYIRAMERGEVPKSHEVLREAKSLTHRLPVLNSEIFQEEYYTVVFTLFTLEAIHLDGFCVIDLNDSNITMCCFKLTWHRLPKPATTFTNSSQSLTYCVIVKALWVVECVDYFSELWNLFIFKENCVSLILIHIRHDLIQQCLLYVCLT